MTTPNINKSLSDIFDVELSHADKSISELKIGAKAESIDSLEQQRAYVKTNIVALLEKGAAALDEMMAVAVTSESYKDYKVVAEMLKTLADVNKSLLDVEVVHKPKAEPEGGVPNTVNNTTNTVFVGSTADLQKHLASKNTIESK